MSKKGVKLGDPDWHPYVKKLWSDAQTEFGLGPDALSTLRVSCTAYQRLLEAEQILKDEGLTFLTSTGQIKQHPACQIVKNERAGFLAAIRLLGLEYDDQKLKRGPGRPPGP